MGFICHLHNAYRNPIPPFETECDLLSHLCDLHGFNPSSYDPQTGLRNADLAQFAAYITACECPHQGCDRLFPDFNSVDNHLALIHGDNEGFLSVVKQCIWCGCRYATDDDVMKHVLQMHPENLRSDDDDPQDHVQVEEGPDSQHANDRSPQNVQVEDWLDSQRGNDDGPEHADLEEWLDSQRNVAELPSEIGGGRSRDFQDGLRYLAPRRPLQSLSYRHRGSRLVFGLAARPRESTPCTLRS